MAQLLENGAPFHGTYTIVRLIGRGGIGEVYEAKHEFLGRRVAIKCLRLKSTLPKTAAQRMAKEAQSLCALDHPNIIRIYDAGVEGELVFMVTELLDGGTLRDKLEAERRMMLLPALRFHHEWADALVQVHAAGIIHRDLKPENVFITKGGQSKLLDFGAALDSQRITMIGHTVGTPAYMAPEHLAGDREIDARADVYPMGVMLYEALTGQHPFVLPSDQDLPDHFEFARRHLLEPWPMLTQVLPGTPPAIEAIVNRCLAKNRDERFPTMVALREALRVALDDASQPTAMPLVQRVPDAATKTRPLTRQTAMRLERGMATRGPQTQKMTPVPPIGAAVSPFAATAPLDASRFGGLPATTVEDRAVTPAPAPISPATISPGLAVAMPPQAVIPSRAPAAIAVLSIGFLAVCLAAWFYLRSGSPAPASEPSPPSTSSVVAPPPVASSSEIAAPSPPVSATEVAAPPPTPPSDSASSSATAPDPPVEPPIAPPKVQPPRPIAKPHPVSNPPRRPGPTPIFE